MHHQMSDKDTLGLLLSLQKFMAAEYDKTASHTDDPALLQTLTNIIAEEQRTRLSIYEAMHQRGWYNPKQIEQSQIDQARQKFQQTSQQLRNIVANAGQRGNHAQFGWGGQAQSQTPQYQSQTLSYPSQTPSYQSQTPAYQSQSPSYPSQTPSYQYQNLSANAPTGGAQSFPPSI